MTQYTTNENHTLVEILPPEQGWEHFNDVADVGRLKIPEGWLYRHNGIIVFVPSPNYYESGVV